MTASEPEEREGCSRHEEYNEDCYSCQYRHLRKTINPEEYR